MRDDEKFVTWYIGLRHHNPNRGRVWGWRCLGESRYSLDFGSWSLIFEHF